MPLPTRCALCPRLCGANRRTQPGRCGGGRLPQVALAAPHHWEEPCISGTKGSGTVFFAGCGLGCLYCQNHAISRGAAGKPQTTAQLATTFLGLQRQGVHNLNLVTATHYRPWVQAALAEARKQGLTLPVVWNTGGYETQEAMEALRQDVDIWLFDLKFFSPRLSGQLADAPNYFKVASAALVAACAMAGPPLLDTRGLLQKGVILRILVLPGHRQDAKQLLAWAAENLPSGGFLLSLMSQYTPPSGLALPPPLNRRLSSFEYRDVADTAHALGFTRGYLQQAGSAGEQYLPPFEG